MWDRYGPSFFCEEGMEFVSNSQKKRAFSSDRLLTYLGFMMSQLDSKDPNCFEDYGTGGRRKRKF